MFDFEEEYLGRHKLVGFQDQLLQLVGCFLRKRIDQVENDWLDGVL